MVDIKQEDRVNTTPSVQVAEASVAQNQPAEENAATAAPAPKRKASRGERIYDWTVYSGLNYWVNLVLSLVIADSVMHGKGKPFLEKTTNKISRGNDKVAHNAKVGLEQLALNAGGWLLLIPMKIMEDNKRPIVHWLNKRLGVDQTAEDGHEMTAKEIYIAKEQPKQSWLRVVGRRALASGATIVAGIGLDHLGKGTREEPITVNGKEVDTIGGKERFTNFIVKKSEQVLKSGYIPGGKKLAAQSWTHRYLSLGALDVINTKITATVMYLTRGAKKVNGHHKHEELVQSLKQEEAAEAAQTTSNFTNRVQQGGRTHVNDTSQMSYTQKLENEPQPSLQTGL